MQQSTTQNLWLNSLLLVLCLASCGRMQVAQMTQVECKSEYYWKLFDSTHTTHQYKTEVTLYGKFFSGILVLKQINDTTCRSAFTTVMGAKLFELIVSPQKDSVIYTIPQMSNNTVVAAIAKDIRTFALLNKFTTLPLCRKEDKVDGEIVERRTKQEIYRYFYKRNNLILNQIQVLSEGFKTKTLFDLTYASNAVLPKDVYITHLNFKLKIHLTSL